MKLDTPLIDALREHGIEDDMLRWLEQPEAVRFILKEADFENAEYGSCSWANCDADVGFAGERGVHRRDCKVVEAWRALGDPRADADFEKAWDAAHEEQARRMTPFKPPSTPTSWAGRITMLSDPRMRDGEVRIIDSARFMEQFNDAAKEAFKDFDQKLYESNPLTGLIGGKKP